MSHLDVGQSLATDIVVKLNRKKYVYEWHVIINIVLMVMCSLTTRTERKPVSHN